MPFPDRPYMASDWQALAVAARRILAQREATDSEQVEKGRITRAQAADRLRIARALSTFWDSVAAGRFPYDAETAWIESRGAEGAYPHELRIDLTNAATRTRALADRKGEDADAEHFAQCVEALAWHARPRDHISHIFDVAHANATWRASRSGECNAA